MPLVGAIAFALVIILFCGLIGGRGIVIGLRLIKDAGAMSWLGGVLQIVGGAVFVSLGFMGAWIFLTGWNT